MHWTNAPAEARLDPDRFDRVLSLAADWCDAGELPAVTILAGRSDIALHPWSFGRLHSGSREPLPNDAIYTVASITKPITAMAVLQLVERGLLTLGDRVCDLIPEFGGKGRYSIRVRHLLTHTSGLPDLLPHDRDLRRANAPLSQYFADTCRADLLFAPGRGVRYSSCAFLVLAEICERITGFPFPMFVAQELFAPLGMVDTALGAPPEWWEGRNDRSHRLTAVQVPDEQDGGETWNWNSRYWRTLGAPWGGLLSTATDLAAFAAMMLNHGRYGDLRLFAGPTIAAATTNQLEPMREIPEADRRCRGWGYGWRLHWPAQGVHFGDLAGPQAYGHWGATGTVLWIDPEHDFFIVLLSTLPQDPDGRYLGRLSNALVAAIL